MQNVDAEVKFVSGIVRKVHLGPFHLQLVEEEGGVSETKLSFSVVLILIRHTRLVETDKSLLTTIHWSN